MPGRWTSASSSCGMPGSTPWTRGSDACWPSGSGCCPPCCGRPGNWQCSVSATTTGGTGEMSNTRYRRGKLYAADMAVYTRQMAADNSAELSRLKRNLIRALKEDVTPRQREVLTLYYAQGLNMREIGERLGVDKSTVSRNIKRGERRLQRCLRYGAEAFLRNLYD